MLPDEVVGHIVNIIDDIQDVENVDDIYNIDDIDNIDDNDDVDNVASIAIAAGPNLAIFNKLPYPYICIQNSCENL